MREEENEEAAEGEGEGEGHAETREEAARGQKRASHMSHTCAIESHVHQSEDAPSRSCPSLPLPISPACCSLFVRVCVCVVVCYVLCGCCSLCRAHVWVCVSLCRCARRCCCVVVVCFAHDVALVVQTRWLHVDSDTAHDASRSDIAQPQPSGSVTRRENDATEDTSSETQPHKKHQHTQVHHTTCTLSPVSLRAAASLLVCVAAVLCVAVTCLSVCSIANACP